MSDYESDPEWAAANDYRMLTEPPRYSTWEDENHEQLSELFALLHSVGQRTMGACFCQHARYAQFAEWVYDHTII